VLPSLPPELAGEPLGDWTGVSPEQLERRLRDSVASAAFQTVRAARALRYAHDPSAITYDEIAHRFVVANESRGAVPLQSLREGIDTARSASRARLAKIRKTDSRIEQLAHRLIELPEITGSVSFEVLRRHIRITPHDERGRVTSGPWLFSLTTPPSALLDGAVDSDESLHLSRRVSLPLPGAAWVRLADLIRWKRFPRFQQCRDALVIEMQDSAFHCFISHRWLSAEAADPDGVQARLLTWQLVAHVCDAVRTAYRRGLHVPRRRHGGIGSAVYLGFASSTLGESIIVNLMRQTLDDDLLAELWQEVESFRDDWRDGGLWGARQDPSLRILNELLAERPLLTQLLGRVHLWYDYSCIPQPPRTAEEDELFHQCLANLEMYQAHAKTAVLLEDIGDFLSRGWCALEMLIVDLFADSFNILAASTEAEDEVDAAAESFASILQDRVHLIWRALLDTELFRIQTKQECMARLGLAVTEPRDVLVVYDRLRRHTFPLKVHYDDGEVVTGTLACPVIDGAVIVPREAPGRQTGTPVSEGNIDTGGAMALDAEALPPEWSAEAVSSYWTVESLQGRDTRSCHVVVVAACEGEALLFSHWAVANQLKIEEQLGVRVQSYSWVATDIAPVGHFANGMLRPAGVDAQTWVIVATTARHHICKVLGTIRHGLDLAGTRRFDIYLDGAEPNVRHYAPPNTGLSDDTAVRVPVGELPGTAHRGGLYRRFLTSHLMRRAS
jgi:hypothetical protein